MEQIVYVKQQMEVILLLDIQILIMEMLLEIMEVKIIG